MAYCVPPKADSTVIGMGLGTMADAFTGAVTGTLLGTPVGAGIGAKVSKCSLKIPKT